VVLDPEDPATEFRLEDWSASDLRWCVQPSPNRRSRIGGKASRCLWIPNSKMRWMICSTRSRTVTSPPSTSPSQRNEEPPEGVLGRLYSIGDRLSRDAADAVARSDLFQLAAVIDPHQPPFGMPQRSWSKVVEAARGLAGALPMQSLMPAR
jgi:hypothetical protein